MIARSVGAGDLERAQSIERQSSWLAAGAGLLLGLVTLVFPEALLRIMGAEPDVLEAATVYFRFVGVPTVFLALMTIFGSILRASGDTKTPLRVSLWMVTTAFGYPALVASLNLVGVLQGMGDTKGPMYSTLVGM